MSTLIGKIMIVVLLRNINKEIEECNRKRFLIK